MSEIIEINTPALLPHGVTMYGPMTEDEYQRTTITGRVFRLTRNSPHLYREYYIEPTASPEAADPS